MLERLSQQVSPYLDARRWYVAYSGGLDSHVLLHALSALSGKGQTLPPLLAVHVNHQIQPGANAWEEHCRQQAFAIGIECLSFRVDVDATGNVEENARKARYEVFSSLLEEGDCLFMAHQQDDNAETFFYRLFRGAGLHGLLSIEHERAVGKGKLVRPLLSFSRSELECYASANHLHYVTDPSNTDTRFDRNYIRHQILPLINKRWPASNAVIGRTIRHLREAHLLLDEIASADLEKAERNEFAEPALDLRHVLSCSEARQRNLVRYWLLKNRISLSSRQTETLFQNVIHASMDAEPVLFAGHQALRRYRQCLFITRNEQPAFDTISWNGKHSCEIPGYGSLQLNPPLDIQLEIRQRRGGEQIKPAGAAHTRKLKTLLQDMQVAPWHRETLPLVYHQGELIAIADILVSEAGSILLRGSQIICVTAD